MLYNLLAVFIGGGAGAVLRYALSAICKIAFNLNILGTFFVNLAGCFLIGLFTGLIAAKFPSFNPAVKLFIITGFLGGLTTFSTFSLEAFELIKSGNIAFGLGYIILSSVLGLICVYIGYSLS